MLPHYTQYLILALALRKHVSSIPSPPPPSSSISLTPDNDTTPPTITSAPELSKRREQIIVPSVTFYKPNNKVAPMKPIKMIPRDNERTVLNHCGRWGGTNENGWVNVKWTCYQDKDVFSTDPATKPEGVKIWPNTAVSGSAGPCMAPGNRAYGNERAGWWPGKDIECILFYDDQCRFAYTDKKGIYWSESPAVVLQFPGLDFLEEGWWQNKTANKLWANKPWSTAEGGSYASGPFSYQCNWKKVTGQGRYEGLGGAGGDTKYVGL